MKATVKQLEAAIALAQQVGAQQVELAEASDDGTQIEVTAYYSNGWQYRILDVDGRTVAVSSAVR